MEEIHKSVENTTDIVELTAQDMLKISQYPNVYSEDNRPISYQERN